MSERSPRERGFNYKTLAFSETYWVVLEVEVPDGIAPTNLGHATVQYVDTVARGNRRHKLTLTPTGSIPNKTVAVHAIGLWTSEITFYALDDLYQYDREAAQKRLSRHIKVLRSVQKVLPAPQFLDDQVTVAKLISLASNLDLPLAWQDPGAEGGVWAYTAHTMNMFGRVRAGYNRSTYTS